jgi:hypothetical protein
MPHARLRPAAVDISLASGSMPTPAKMETIRVEANAHRRIG